MRENKKNMSKILELLKNTKIEWKKIGEVCEILDHKRFPIKKENRISGQYPYYGANGIQDYVNNYIFDGTYILIGEDGSVITKRGNPIVHWASGKIWVNNHAQCNCRKRDSHVEIFILLSSEYKYI